MTAGLKFDDGDMHQLAGLVASQVVQQLQNAGVFHGKPLNQPNGLQPNPGITGANPSLNTAPVDGRSGSQMTQPDDKRAQLAT